jgi:predicted DNA-binding transcriptional regulator YafY
VNRIDRLTAIIILLQSRQYIGSEEIAQRFGISLRTVYRDLRALEEAGVPVGIESGRGYFLVDGYHLPPVMFTKDEARALILAEKLLAQSTDSSIYGQFESALTKIKAVLKHEEKLVAEQLESRITVTTFPNIPDSGGFMVQILQAVSEKKKLDICYRASYNNQETSRIIEPFGIVYYGLDWHLIAYCNLRNDFRDFKISRIKKLQITDEIFKDRDSYCLLSYYDYLSKTSDLERVKVIFDKSVVKELGNVKYYHGLISEKETEYGVEMILASNSLEYTGKWLLTFMGKVEIIGPPELKKILRNFTLELKDKYLK